MAINLARRQAFMHAFVQYPNYIESFSTMNCNLVKNGSERPPMKEEDFRNVMRVAMAQFAVRLIRTRAENSTPELQDFSMAAVNRYLQYREKLLGEGTFIEAPARYRAAFNEIERGMGELIFETLAVEASFPTKNGEEFVEVDFWRDVFMAMIQNQQHKHPKWREPLAAVITDHMNEFRVALEAVPANG